MSRTGIIIKEISVATGSKSDWEKIVQSKHIQKWLEQSKSLHILITGKTGVGKSALVNGIVGKYVAKEGETLDPETSTVMAVSHTHLTLPTIYSV